MDALSVVCSLLKLIHNNRCVKVWRSYKEEEEGEERMKKSSDAKVKPLSRGKRKDLDRSKVEEQETTFLVVLDIMCMATYTAAKCQRAKSARHVAIHAASVLECFLGQADWQAGVQKPARLFLALLFSYLPCNGQHPPHDPPVMPS